MINEQYGLQQTDLASNTTTSVVRSYNYGNHSEGQTAFAPNNITDNNGTDVNETYGINGSLLRREINIPGNQPETEYYHFTINGNMQAYIYDNLLYTYYGYDNANSRKYKISYQNSPTWINGQPQPTELHLRNIMFYPNSYLNFNNDGHYTKHYYNGMERIASRLGDQGIGMAQQMDGDLLSRKNDLGKVFVEQFQEMLGNQDSIKLHDTLQLRDLQPNPAGGLYYYHPNHLGSTCYVTDGNASVQQGFLYAPFGEITNEYNVGWQNGNIPKYAFNAKELDEETGMYYYEARYMAPPVFISRDRLFEKYPTFSPYTYCANNPVKYVDPTGDTLDIRGGTQAQKDILSIVAPVYRERVLFTNNRVSVNTDGLSNEEIENDAGLSVLYRMTTSNNHYLYQAEEVLDKQGDPIKIWNNSITPFLELEYRKKMKEPLPDGYQGWVVIHPNLEFNAYEGGGYVSNRPSTVFHELEENYQRTDMKLPYLYLEKNNRNKEDTSRLGAHGISIKKAEKLTPSARSVFGTEGEAYGWRINK